MYNIDWLKGEQEKGSGLKFVYFWGHAPRHKDTIDASCFSQWFESPFTVNGIVYRTAEHWMMAQKALTFNDHKNWRQIIDSHKPGEAKALGRSVENYVDEIWQRTAFDLVTIGNIHKFNQHPEMYAYLLQTNNRVLVEASPVDTIWGIGLSKDNDHIEDVEKWKGSNWLGFALMKARDFLSGFGSFEPLSANISLPWIEYPSISPSDGFWRMGKGEEMIRKIANYMNTLTDRQKTIFQVSNPPLGEWKSFYEDFPVT